MILNQTTLRTIGEALYGPSWQTPLAAALISHRTGRPIDLRTIQRWANGEFEIPQSPDLMKQLASLARTRGGRLKDLAKDLDRAASKAA
jgi:hypothetical protein